MSSPDELIAANRARRQRDGRRRRMVLATSVIALVASIAVDSALGWPSDGGSGPFALALAGCISFGALWNDARRREGIERDLVGRAAVAAMAVVVAYAAVAYVIWLVDHDDGARPGLTLMVAGVGLMLGTLVGGSTRSDPGDADG